MQTQLIINRGGFPPFSARGCQQTLQPLDTGELRRTVNGDLVYTGKKGHHKYLSIIECQDEAPPVLEGIWRGESVDIQCIQRLWQEIIIDDETDVLKIKLDRKSVTGSVIALRDGETEFALQVIDSDNVEIQHRFQKDDRVYIHYRPQLQMRVTNFTLVTNEWRQTCGWRLLLEEI